MAEREKQGGFMGIVRDTLSFVSQIISASIFPPIAAGTEMVVKHIEDGIIRMEKRILRRISSLLVIGFGGTFLIFALFFYLTEFLRWTNALASFSIGIVVFVVGLLLKVAEPDR